MLEAEFQDRYVIPEAKRQGFKVYHTHRSDRSPAGFPDLVLVHPVRRITIFAELKSDTGKVSTEQHEWLTALTQAGQICHVWYPEDMPEIRRILGGRP